MRPIVSNSEKVNAAAAVALSLLEHASEMTERYPTGTRFTPLGTEDGTLKVLVETPDGIDAVERVLAGSAV